MIALAEDVHMGRQQSGASSGGDVAHRLCCLVTLHVLEEGQWAQPSVLKLLLHT